MNRGGINSVLHKCLIESLNYMISRVYTYNNYSSIKSDPASKT